MENIKELKEAIKHIHVLFVDDEDDIRKGTGAFLKKFFTKVTICKNGEEGLEAFKNNQDINLLITDIKMPKMDGMSMAKQIKEIKPSIFLIFITASRSFEYSEEKLSDIYIKKPLSYEDMLNVLNKVKEIK